jgi:hypothetical protein
MPVMEDWGPFFRRMAQEALSDPIVRWVIPAIPLTLVWGLVNWMNPNPWSDVIEWLLGAYDAIAVVTLITKQIHRLVSGGWRS